ncbi:hypothetical protein QSJ19_01075 [Gordonia sp. ABSL11-1]|uniref:hypothetical protein n=1 Tax=Gordonia sp. ABSL11-1 TaxID=3053924 RepID=UPI0025722F0B|nr:hypothetical protein [Gordonia sp. ABSL11-1]MDL9944194.1 hypothetical protein [Gordonia sp. ABSL11-1]
MSDILDEIDALIDEQLEAGESGAQQRAARADRRCPHCFRTWHGLAITQRLERMRIEYQDRALNARLRGEESEYAESAILDGYRYDEDDSRVICPGSDFIGPIQTPPRCGCAQCLAWRAVIGDDETPGDVARRTSVGDAFIRMEVNYRHPSFPTADELIRQAISFAGDLALDPSAWRDIGRIADGGFVVEQQADAGPSAWTLDAVQSLRWGSQLPSGQQWSLTIGDLGPNRAERRHPDPESDAERDSDDPPTSLADLRRRVRERGSRPQERPVWAERMDGRRVRR